MDHVTRRGVLKGGGSLLGLWFLAGCQSSKSAGLPDPVLPSGDLPPSSPPTYTQVPPAPMPAPPVSPAPMMPSGVIPRTQWTTAAIGRPKNINPMNGVSRITVHHDGMNAFTSTAMADAAHRLAQIRSAHMQRKAKSGEYWADIGYHYIIDPAGRVWEGRPVQYQGAHVEDQNEHNLGIMCLGDFELQQPSSATLASLDSFVASQMRLYRVPVGRVYTHQELPSQTLCPGKSLQRYMTRTRARGGNLMLACAGDPALLIA